MGMTRFSLLVALAVVLVGVQMAGADSIISIIDTGLSPAGGQLGVSNTQFLSMSFTFENAREKLDQEAPRERRSLAV